MRAFTALVLAGSVVLAGGCRRPVAPPEDASPSADGRLSVFVSIPPQAYFVERIAGERVRIEVLVPPGQSPATYEPTPTQMAALAGADALLRIGVPFENGLMARIGESMPGLNVVDTRTGVPLRSFGEHGAEDPHIWLAPRLVEIQAGTIADELARLDPAHADEYEANRAAFVRELDALHEELAAVLPEGATITVFHPSWGYFCDEFGLRQVAIEVGGKEPAPRRLQQMIEEARARQVSTVFVEPQFSSASAQAIAREIGAQVVSLDPLARDWADNLRDVAHKIADAAKSPPAAQRHSDAVAGRHVHGQARPAEDRGVLGRGQRGRDRLGARIVHFQERPRALRLTIDHRRQLHVRVIADEDVAHPDAHRTIADLPADRAWMDGS